MTLDLFSAAIPVTPKAAQPRGKAPLKALLRVELQVGVVLLSLCPGGEQSQPCRRNPRTQPAADGFILPFPDSRGAAKLCASVQERWCSRNVPVPQLVAVLTLE